MATQDTILFAGRDILAAENHLRQGTFAAALEIVYTMPAEIVTRLAAHVGADASDLTRIVLRARLPYSER